MKKTTLFVIHRLAEFGELVVYERGLWHRRHGIPKYLVSNLATGRDLEEFRRKADAIRWAYENSKPKRETR